MYSRPWSIVGNDAVEGAEDAVGMEKVVAGLAVVLAWPLLIAFASLSASRDSATEAREVEEKTMFATV